MNRLIVALGNPGNQYANTRHNVAWMVFDHYEKSKNLNWKSKFKGELADISDASSKIYFLKPQTFMNLSGESVLEAMQFFKIDKENVMVLHDELDMPYGTIAFKKGGGHAGHNGLRSIGECTGNLDFLRLRIGIGRPDKGSVSNWVLSPFSMDEKAILERYLDLCKEALVTYIEKGFEKASTMYSKKNIGV